MRCLFTVLTDRPAPATPAESDAIDAFNDRLRAAGGWVLAGGLEDPRARLLVDERAASAPGEPPIDVEPTWYAAGLWILDVPDREAAARWAREASEACNRVIDVRRFL